MSISNHTRLIRCALLGLLLVAGATGCNLGKKPNQAKLTSTDGTVALNQTFSRAYATKTPDGNYEVVLVDDGVKTKRSWNPLSQPTATPLAPLNTPPVRQVLVLQVNWRPGKGARNDNPAAANAVARWYLSVYENQQERVLRYDGTAFVQLSQDRQGNWRGRADSNFMKLFDSQGQQSSDQQDAAAASMVAAQFDARFVAENNPALVKDLMSTLPKDALPSAAARVAATTTRASDQSDTEGK